MGTVTDLNRVRLERAGSRAEQMAVRRARLARHARLTGGQVEKFNTILVRIEESLCDASRALGNSAVQLRDTAQRCRQTARLIEEIEA